MQSRNHQTTIPWLVSQITCLPPRQRCGFHLPPIQIRRHQQGSTIWPHLFTVRIFIHSTTWPPKTRTICPGQTWDVSLSGWIDWYHNTPQSTPPTTTYVWTTSISVGICMTPLLSSSPLSTTIPCFPSFTHKWTPANTHYTPSCITKLWYPLYLSLHPKH